MSIRLRLLVLWTPPWVVSAELQRVAQATIGTLDALLERHAPLTLQGLRDKEADGKSKMRKATEVGGARGRRREMAISHAARVSALIDAIGRERALIAGREAMSATGERLGREARIRLGVGSSMEDAIRAARVLYRVLGISFEVEAAEGGRTWLCVDRCQLAKDYTPESCLVLSAADEGVVRGLNPKLKMTFTERMTGGCRRCMASIEAERLDMP